MSESVGIIKCNLCNRDYKKWNKYDFGKIVGISLKRSSTYSQVLDFVDVDKSEINVHLCNYCIADVLNKFGV